MNCEWGDEVDYNVVHIHSGSDKAKPTEILKKDSKKDVHSVICNCRFKYIEGGDYTVQNQEVLDCGFVNFDMERFGVVSPRLKILSKMPELPSINPFLDKENSEKDFYEYRGVTYKNITSL